MMFVKKIALLLWACTLTLPSLCQAQNDPPQSLPSIDLTAGIHIIKAMVADSAPEQQMGLMFRREMKTNEGMLFVFERAAPQCFWMKNTPLPLSAAFIDDDGRIVNIEDMQPLSLDSHCSTKPVRYVLEMHQGWFAKRGLKAGDKLGGTVFNSSQGPNQLP